MKVERYNVHSTTQPRIVSPLPVLPVGSPGRIMTNRYTGKYYIGPVPQPPVVPQPPLEPLPAVVPQPPFQPLQPLPLPPVEPLPSHIWMDGCMYTKSDGPVANVECCFMNGQLYIKSDHVIANIDVPTVLERGCIEPNQVLLNILEGGLGSNSENTPGGLHMYMEFLDELRKTAGAFDMVNFDSLLFDDDFKGISAELFLLAAAHILLLYGVVVTTWAEKRYPILLKNISHIASVGLLLTLLLFLTNPINHGIFFISHYNSRFIN